MDNISTTLVIVTLAGLVIAHLTALVSNTKAIPAWAGGYVTAALATATGFLAEWGQDPNNYDWKQGALKAALAFLTTIGAHYGVVKDTPVQSKLIDLGASRANRRGGKPAPDDGEYDLDQVA